MVTHGETQYPPMHPELVRRFLRAKARSAGRVKVSKGLVGVAVGYLDSTLGEVVRRQFFQWVFDQSHLGLLSDQQKHAILLWTSPRLDQSGEGSGKRWRFGPNLEQELREISQYLHAAENTHEIQLEESPIGSAGAGGKILPA